MKDGIIKGDGTSRFMKANLPASYEEFRQLAAAGTLPMDVLFNAAGWSQQPDFLNKANLLSDEAAGKIGIPAESVPNDALLALLQMAQTGVSGLRYIEITESTNWVAPQNIVDNDVFVLCVGGGGGMEQGGGGGGHISYKHVKVVPGQSYPAVIGAAGSSSSKVTNGGATSFAGITANGGSKANGYNGGSGGAGGGAGSQVRSGEHRGNGGNGSFGGGGGASRVKSICGTGGKGGTFGGAGGGKRQPTDGKFMDGVSIALFNSPDDVSFIGRKGFDSQSTTEQLGSGGFGGNGGSAGRDGCGGGGGLGCDGGQGGYNGAGGGGGGLFSPGGISSYTGGDYGGGGGGGGYKKFGRGAGGHIKINESYGREQASAGVVVLIYFQKGGELV